MAAAKRKVGISAVPAHDHDADWAALLAAVKSTLGAAKGPFFTTDAAGLNEAFLSDLGGERAIHDCYACRKFIENFGGLVTIGDDGRTASAFWDHESLPAFYRSVVKDMERRIVKARVTGVFLCSETKWGQPATGQWTHFGVISPSVYQKRLLTAGQAMAAKREDHHTVSRALTDFTPETLAEAARLLEAEHLSRSEKFLGPVHWLAELHAQRGAAKDARVRDNLLWRAVATAPDGFCHPRSSVVGSLLEDIVAGMAFDEIKARFEAKTHTLRYQRPQAAPTAANIEAAEKAFEALGIASALERRFARLDELQLAWSPVALKKDVPKGGVFGHLSRKRPESVTVADTPSATMTWEKFCRAVLPGAEQIEARIATGNMNFIALTGAQHDDALPILKWDRAEKRNRIAWYVYNGGSPAQQWGLSPGWASVTGISQLPPMWGDNPQPHLGEGFVLVVAGCVDTRTGQGNSLFPECLINDVHGVRATIEAYSRRAVLGGVQEASACGLDVRRGAKALNYRLRVTSCGAQTEYTIDRWD